MKLKKKDFLRDAGLRLRQLRQELDYTRSEMAERLGTNRGAYGKNERGENLPKTEVLYRLSSEYNISMDWLFFGKGGKYSEDPSQRGTLETRVSEGEHEITRLKTELEQSLAKSEQTRTQLEQTLSQLETERACLRQLEEETESLRQSGPEVKEMLLYMRQDPVLYHDLLLRFFSYKEEKSKTAGSKKTKPAAGK